MLKSLGAVSLVDHRSLVGKYFGHNGAGGSVVLKLDVGTNFIVI